MGLLVPMLFKEKMILPQVTMYQLQHYLTLGKRKRILVDT